MANLSQDEMQEVHDNIVDELIVKLQDTFETINNKHKDLFKIFGKDSSDGDIDYELSTIVPKFDDDFKGILKDDLRKAKSAVIDDVVTLIDTNKLASDLKTQNSDLFNLVLQSNPVFDYRPKVEKPRKKQGDPDIPGQDFGGRIKDPTIRNLNPIVFSLSVVPKDKSIKVKTRAQVLEEKQKSLKGKQVTIDPNAPSGSQTPPGTPLALPTGTASQSGFSQLSRRSDASFINKIGKPNELKRLLATVNNTRNVDMSFSEMARLIRSNPNIVPTLKDALKRSIHENNDMEDIALLLSNMNDLTLLEQRGQTPVDNRNVILRTVRPKNIKKPKASSQRIKMKRNII